MATIEEKLEKVLARERRLKVQKRRLSAAVSEKHRKRDARRKIILGGGLIALARQGDAQAAGLITRILTAVDRDVDKKAIEDWNPLEINPDSL